MTERFYIATAGTEGRPRNLEACLRDVWNAQRAAVLKRIEHRTEYGIPLDSDTDFDALLEALEDVEAAGQKANGPAALAALEKANALLAPQPKDPGEYPGQPQYAPITLRLRAVSSRTYRGAIAAIRQAQSEHKGDNVAAWAALVDAQRDFVRQAAADVSGLEDDAGPRDLRAVPPHRDVNKRIRNIEFRESNEKTSLVSPATGKVVYRYAR